jgi:hypothetical protein
MLQGGCYCKVIRYETGGVPFHRTTCHCSICRGTSGAPCLVWFSVPRAEFRVVAGKLTYFQSSPNGKRGFCGRCGTQLTFEDADFADEIDVTTCSLDRPEALPPEDHTFTLSKLSWLRPDDRLPRFATRRERSEP